MDNPEKERKYLPAILHTGDNFENNRELQTLVRRIVEFVLLPCLLREVSASQEKKRRKYFQIILQMTSMLA